jgi:hypothetical protein
MDLFEQAVLHYLCGPPERFVSAQFNIPYECFQGGSCPDFVVIDYRDKTIYVVEVTQSADTKAVMQRVANRETRWLGPLRNHFQNLSPLFKDWGFHVSVFVRGEEAEAAQRAVEQVAEVSVISLDNVVFSWRWDWKGRRPSNPLRDPGKPPRGALTPA